jgi:Predicted membrane protein
MNLLDIFIASVMTYVYLAIILRLLGKKEFSQLNVFDFVVFLIIAEIMVISIESDSLDFVHSIVASLTLIIIDRIVSLINIRWKKARTIFEGKASYIIYKGKLNQQKMKELRYTVDDLTHHLRMNNIDSVSIVEFAVLERNGSLSIIKKDDCVVELPEPIVSDGNIDYESLQRLGKTDDWLEDELKRLGYPNYKEIFYCVLEKEGLYVIKK